MDRQRSYSIKKWLSPLLHICLPATYNIFTFLVWLHRLHPLASVFSRPNKWTGSSTSCIKTSGYFISLLLPQPRTCWPSQEHYNTVRASWPDSTSYPGFLPHTRHRQQYRGTSANTTRRSSESLALLLVGVKEIVKSMIEHGMFDDKSGIMKVDMCNFIGMKLSIFFMVMHALCSYTVDFEQD